MSETYAANDLLHQIRGEVRKGNHRFTIHAGERMTERYIAVEEVEEVILDGGAEVVENYPEDPRGSSCLVLGVTSQGRALHIQCSHPPIVAIITAYEPDPGEWTGLKIRK